MQEICVNEVPDIVPVIGLLVFLNHLAHQADYLPIVVAQVLVQVGVCAGEDLPQDGYEPCQVGHWWAGPGFVLSQSQWQGISLDQ